MPIFERWQLIFFSFRLSGYKIRVAPFTFWFLQVQVHLNYTWETEKLRFIASLKKKNPVFSSSFPSIFSLITSLRQQRCSSIVCSWLTTLLLDQQWWIHCNACHHSPFHPCAHVDPWLQPLLMLRRSPPALSSVSIRKAGVPRSAQLFSSAHWLVLFALAYQGLHHHQKILLSYTNSHSPYFKILII